MPVVIDLVERDLLQGEPPRRLPLLFVPNLLGEYLLERPLISYFDPLLLGGLVAALALALLQVGPLLWLLLGAILAVRLGIAAWRIGRRVAEDRALLRYGIVIYAHILEMRPSRDSAGQIDGAYLDCAIPVGRRRTSVGSVWMPDAAEAARLGRLGRVLVICLPRAPGAWRLLEYKSSALRYEPLHAGV